MKFPWKSGSPKTAFITGGGSGLGLGFAQLLLGEGTRLALFDLRFDPAIQAQLRTAAAQSGTEVEFHTCDVTDLHSVEAALQAAVMALGAPDLAIHCAGVIGEGVPVTSSTPARFEQIMAINLFGSRNFAAAVLPQMHAGAHFVLTASLAGKIGNFAYGDYCASKYATVGLAEVLRIEQYLRGICVSVLCPGEVETPLVTEERSRMHPVTRELKAFAGCLSAQEACRQMMHQLARRKFSVIPGFRARLTAVLGGAAPGLLHWIVNRKARHAWQAMSHHPAGVSSPPADPGTPSTSHDNTTGKENSHDPD